MALTSMLFFFSSTGIGPGISGVTIPPSLWSSSSSTSVDSPLCSALWMIKKEGYLPDHLDLPSRHHGHHLLSGLRFLTAATLMTTILTIKRYHCKVWRAPTFLPENSGSSSSSSSKSASLFVSTLIISHFLCCVILIMKKNWFTLMPLQDSRSPSSLWSRGVSPHPVVSPNIFYASTFSQIYCH